MAYRPPIISITENASFVVTTKHQEAIVLLDTTANDVVGTLPASNVDGDAYTFKKVGAINSASIGGNSININGLSEFQFSEDQETITLIYDTVDGWNIHSRYTPLVDTVANSSLQNGLIFGGAIWTTGLSFAVSNVRFAIEGIIYDAAEDTVTLIAADATNPRIDVIVANTDGTISIITGTPAATPVKPEIDLFTQVEITFATISATAIVPDGITSTDIYQENAGDPAEWDATENTATARVTLADGASAHTGTVGIRATGMIVGDAITFTEPTTPVSTTGFSSIALYMKAIAGQPWGSDGRLNLQFFSGIFPASDIVVIKDSPGEWNSNSTSDWVLRIFDKNKWNFTAATFDSLRISVGQGTLHFRMDVITYLEGMSGSSVSTNIYTADGSVTSTRTVIVPEPFNFIIDGQQGASHDFLVQGFDSITLFSDTGGVETATLNVDWDASARLTHQGVTYKTEFQADANSVLMDLSGGASAGSVSIFSTDNGKIALEANAYRFGDGAGASLPPIQASPTHIVVVNQPDGHIELATLASTLNLHSIQIESFEGNAAVIVGDGTKAITIPSFLNTWELTNVVASVEDKGITGTTNVIVRRWRAGIAADMLSTAITIGDEWFAQDGVIDLTNDDVSTGDRIYIDVDAIHSGTAPNGLSVVLEFTKP